MGNLSVPNASCLCCNGNGSSKDGTLCESCEGSGLRRDLHIRALFRNAYRDARNGFVPFNVDDSHPVYAAGFASFAIRHGMELDEMISRSTWYASIYGEPPAIDQLIRSDFWRTYAHGEQVNDSGVWQ